jgi:hypothetical protein
MNAWMVAVLGIFALLWIGGLGLAIGVSGARADRARARLEARRRHPAGKKRAQYGFQEE